MSGPLVERVAEAAESDADPASLFDRPLDVAEAQDAPYEARLAVLQRWRSRAADQEAEDAVDGALQALETGAALRQDEPEGAPEDWGYGARASE